MRHDSGDAAIGVELADENGETPCRVVELAFVEQGGADIGADIHFLGMQRPLSGGHEVEAAQIGQRHHDQRRADHRGGELALAVAGRRHHYQLAVARQALQRRQRAEKECDGQDDGQQRRQQQQDQIGEGEGRLAAIDDQIEQRQDLHQPHHAGEQDGQHRHRAQHLAQHIEGQAQGPQSTALGAGLCGRRMGKGVRGRHLSSVSQIALN